MSKPVPYQKTFLNYFEVKDYLISSGKLTREQEDIVWSKMVAWGEVSNGCEYYIDSFVDYIDEAGEDEWSIPVEHVPFFQAFVDFANEAGCDVFWIEW